MTDRAQPVFRLRDGDAFTSFGSRFKNREHVPIDFGDERSALRGRLVDFSLQAGGLGVERGALGCDLLFRRPSTRLRSS